MDPNNTMNEESTALSTEVTQKPQVVLDNTTKVFSFNELLEVWYFSMLHGATLWQFGIDTDKNLPEDFMVGLDAIRAKLVSPLELQEVLKSRALMVGLFEEAIVKDKEQTTIIVTPEQANTSEVA